MAEDGAARGGMPVGAMAPARAVVPGPAEGDRLKVFISYSRADIAFADELFTGLEWAGFAPTMDRHAIVKGEDWKRRLGGLIADADSLLREKATLSAHAGPVTSVAVSPDGTRIVTGSSDNTAKVWDANTFAELGSLKGHGESVQSIAVSPDGTRIVTGSSDNTAKVWDAKSFAVLATLKSHANWVRSVAVSPDGARIVTGSSDNTAKVWDAKSFAELATLKGHASAVWSVAVSPDGTRIVTGSSDNTAKVWEVLAVGKTLLAEAQRIAPRCLTPEQRHRYHLSPEPPRWCGTLQSGPTIPSPPNYAPSRNNELGSRPSTVGPCPTERRAGTFTVEMNGEDPGSARPELALGSLGRGRRMR